MDQIKQLLKKIGKVDYEEKILKSYKTVINHNDEVTALDLIGINLETLPLDTFIGFGELEKLYLAWNKLSTLDENIFTPLLNINLIDLSGNNLTILGENIFSSNRFLQNIQLNDNNIRNLPINIFKSNNMLLELNLRNNNLCEIKPIHLKTLRNLERLYLYFNPLEEDFADHDYWDKDAVDELKQKLENYYQANF